MDPALAPIDRLVVVYDENCELCRRCRDWLVTQPTHLPLEFLAAGSEAAQMRYGHLPWLGDELVVVAADGRYWAGPAAFLLCLWSTTRYRPWSYRLTGRAFAPMAERFFYAVSHNRRRINAFLRTPECTWCDRPDAGVGSCPTKPTSGAGWAPPGVST